MAFAVRGGGGDEDDALMGDDDIRAWNPSELDDEDDYGDAEASSSEHSEHEEGHGDGDDDERESREDFYESREDEQPSPASEHDSEAVEEDPTQEQRGEEEEDDHVESELDSPGSSSEGDHLDVGDRLEKPQSDEEQDGGAESEAAEQELLTSSWLNVELPQPGSSPSRDHSTTVSTHFAGASCASSADLGSLDGSEEASEAREATGSLPDEAPTATSSALASVSAALGSLSSGREPEMSRVLQATDAPQPVPPRAPAPIHPLPLPRAGSFPTPLSPSSSPHKRSNSLYTTPTVASSALMKRTDSLAPTAAPASGARTSQLWELDPVRRSSRLLDEWKRKEIWHDFKRAEEHVACPSARTSDPLSPSPVEVEAQATQVMSAVVRRGGSRRESSPPPRHTSEDEVARNKRGEKEGRRDNFALGGWKMRREGSWSGDLSPTASSRPKTLERRQTISAESPVASSPRSLAGSLAAICSSSTVSGAVIAPVAPIATVVPVTAAPAPTISMTEFEQVVKDKEALQAEAERCRRAALQDKEAIQSLNERLKQLETLERENRYLKDETQKQLMQDLSAKEVIKTLTDQLALRGKSEEQLKLQTKQLLEQNQSLQADLLEKMAAETDKIQKMARLSADKQALIQELGEKEAEASDRRDTERRKARRRLLLRLVKRKHRAVLLSSMLRWKINAHEVASACCKISSVLLGAVQRGEGQRKARALRLLMANSLREAHAREVAELNVRVESATSATKRQRLTHALSLLASVSEQSRQRRLASALRVLQCSAMAFRSRSRCAALAVSTLQLVVQTKARSSLQRAWTRWRVSGHSESVSSQNERAQEAQDKLVEAKECVFSLSRAKTKLEEKLQAARDDSQHLTNQLAESTAELRLAKHGYAVTVLRASERAWLREFFSEWKVYTNVSLSSKQLRLQVQMAELRASEREKHAKSLDDYARVLKTDLERFQFFSQDKRVAVDVLTKKLSRVEGRYREMEERHAVLEERGHSLKNQLAAFVEWEGATLPFAVLVLCKDVAVGNLRELFMLHATVPAAAAGSSGTGVLVVPPAPSSLLPISAQSGGTAGQRNDVTGGATAPRLSVDALVRLVEASSVVAVEQLVSREDLAERLLRHLPIYAAERGLLFHDFLLGLNDFLGDVVAAGDRKYEQVKQFWASLLGLLTTLRGSSAHSVSGSSSGGVSGLRGGGDSSMMYTPRSSAWAGRLSDDILQNQEKLLAVLEHETAVVERAVMEKASLKHTYPPPADEEGEHAPDSSSTFFEYQCDPVLPPDHSSVVSSPTSSVTAASRPFAGGDSGASPSASTSAAGSAAAILDQYTNWHLCAQIRDLFLACHRPLLKILVQYSDARRDPRHGNQYCLEHAAVTRMLEDMQLCPAFLSRDTISRLFASFRSPVDGLLPPQGFALFLGACALELYAASLAAARGPSTLTASQTAAPPPPVPYLLSAREVLLSFFGDLGLLAESEVPPPSRLAFVGMDVEAILWPLFEYYATGGDPRERPDDERIGMTPATFAAFMGEIAGMGGKAPVIFRRAMLEATRMQPRRKRRSLDAAAQQGGGAALSATSGDASDAELDGMNMFLDDFYVAIGFVQAERVGPGVTFASAGDAVRQWMQQTQ